MMKKKSLGFSVFGVLALLILLGFGSAVPSFSGSTPSPLSQSSGSFTVNVTDTPETVTFTAASTTPDDNLKSIVVTSIDTPSFTFDATHTSKVITIFYTVPSGFVFSAGKTYSITINPFPGTPAVFNFAPTNEPTEISSCKVTGAANATNHLVVSIEDTTVTNGFGSDTDWYPLDNIEIKVNVENTGTTNDIRNVVIKWGLYNKNTQKRVAHGEEKSFTLKDDDEQTKKIDFKLDVSSDFKNSENYVLYIWATGDDKELDTKTCSSDLEDISVITDNPFVILDSLQVVGTASCGNEVQISGKAWNIGDDDEKDVYVKVFNTELGISQRVDVGDIDRFESKDFLVNLDVPDNAETGKSYDLTFLVYDENNDIFENDNGDQSQFTLPLQVTGACTNLPPVSVSATLQSSTVAGKELDVTATIKNTASTTQTFNLELTGYESWASLVSVDRTALTLTAGQSQDVLIKLNVNAGVSGDQNFNIVMKQGSKVLTQPVSVSVQRQGFSLTGLFAGLGGNAYLWAIGALNVILVLVIIIVAVRVVRKK